MEILLLDISLSSAAFETMNPIIIPEQRIPPDVPKLKSMRGISNEPIIVPKAIARAI